jgi:hypothetical protein
VTLVTGRFNVFTVFPRRFRNVLITYLEMIFTEGLSNLKNLISSPTEKQPPYEFGYAELNGDAKTGNLLEIF